MSETNQVRRLTKADILAGSKNVTYVYFEEFGGELPLRSLSDGQWAQIQALRTRGGKLKTGNTAIGKDGNPDLDKTPMAMEIDMEQVALGEYEADCLAVFFGIADSGSWTVDDVKRLEPPGIVAKIAAEVYLVSGVPSRYKGIAARAAERKEKPEEGLLEQARSFREDAGGTADRSASLDGVPADG